MPLWKGKQGHRCRYGYHIFQLDSLLPHFLKYTDCIGNTGFQHVVSVYQKDTCIRVHSCVCLECSILIREAHDPGMCMGSKHWHVKHLTSKHTGCSDTTTDHSCTGSKNTGIRSLGTAKTELHDSVTFRRIADTCCLGSNQALMVHNVQNRSFHKLSFHNRCYHFHHWLSWEITVPSGMA